MSGAPIIQNNKLGYGVFADIMIKEVAKTKN